MGHNVAWGYRLSCCDCSFEIDSFACFDDQDETQMAAESEAVFHLETDGCRDHRVQARMYFEITLTGN